MLAEHAATSLEWLSSGTPLWPDHDISKGMHLRHELHVLSTSQTASRALRSSFRKGPERRGAHHVGVGGHFACPGL